MKKSRFDSQPVQPPQYRIAVEEQLDESWADWLDGMKLTYEGKAGVSSVTVLVGPVVDQAALRNLLTRIMDLNLTLISVTRLEMGAE